MNRIIFNFFNAPFNFCTKEDIFSFLRFILVGGLTAAIYFAIFSLTWKILGFTYTLATTIAYISGVLFQFFSNRKFSFKNKDQSIHWQLIKYIFLLLINYLILILAMHWGVGNLNLSPYLIIILATGFTTFINFILCKFWIFRKEKPCVI